MKGTYVEVTEMEFDVLFKADKGWNKTIKGNEYVYSYVSKKNENITVFVYSSVTPSGVGRKCGGDAIRITAVNTKTNKGIMKSKRVYRTEGWDERTKAKVLETLNEYIK